jgi:uncharacterized protein DUF6288/prenyltransferase/squalene oxidase-like repeat protein
MKYSLITTLLMIFSFTLSAQDIFFMSTSKGIPPDVETIYKKGLSYLASTQNNTGSWNDNYGRNPGVVGLCIVAMLAHGDDPNHGRYSANIKKGINFILITANKKNGYIGSSMYNHGFATLALAESYGALHDDRIGPALKKAVDLILTSQANNQMGAWRYSPTSRDADTTVSGAVLIALLAAANAGIEVPEKAIAKALKFYERCQSADGGFGYSSAGGANMPRSAIGTLVFALAGKKKSNIYKKALSYIETGSTSDRVRNNYFYYYLYYASQAFFHTPGTDKWDKWNKLNIKTLKTLQREDGSWSGQHGTSFSTAAALLSLALNYRFLPIYER